MANVRFLSGENVHGGLLPWVIGVMVFLSGLAIAAALALQSTASSWRGDLGRQLTVQVVTADAAARESEAEAVLARLAETPGIQSATRVDDQGVRDLLEPWLGAGNVTGDLPIPVLIDVLLDDGAAVSPDGLAADLKTLSPGIRVDGHERWLADLLALARILQWTSALIVALVALATVAITVFATRAGLAAQRSTVEIVHLIGAQDGLIAAAFQKRFLAVGLRGGLYGLGLLAVLFGIIALIGTTLESAYLPALTPSPVTVAVLVLLPLPAALIAMLTARYTVLRALAEMV